MKLATLARPLARLQAWLRPSAAPPLPNIQNAILMLAERPHDFEITALGADRRTVFIHPKAGRGLVFGRICLQPDAIWIEYDFGSPQVPSLRDRYALTQAVQAWLAVYN